MDKVEKCEKYQVAENDDEHKHETVVPEMVMYWSIQPFFGVATFLEFLNLTCLQLQMRRCIIVLSVHRDSQILCLFLFIRVIFYVPRTKINAFAS